MVERVVVVEVVGLVGPFVGMVVIGVVDLIGRNPEHSRRASENEIVKHIDQKRQEIARFFPKYYS